jgi:hypothetical protein
VFTCYHHAKRTKRERQIKRDKEEKFVIGGIHEKGKRGSYSILVKRGLVGSPIVVPLGGLVVNILSRFGRHNGAYESNHFVEERRRIVTTTTLTSIGNKTTKVKRLREGGFCVFCFVFGFCFVVGLFFCIFIKPNFFFNH